MADFTWFREQGRDGLRTSLAPPSNDHLYREVNEPREVFILVYGPRQLHNVRARDLHWSIYWEVSGGGGKLIHLVQEDEPIFVLPGQARGATIIPTRRLVYWGPQTRSPGNATHGARRISLGVMSLAHRQEIERIAWKVLVHKPDGQWNCQHWIINLLYKMVDARIISKNGAEYAFGAAHHAWPELSG
ncbi:hypothetical protein C8Q76DRAFT_61293 [Earliella scabrosa]|nr:hypothetical protein C8Q76DRAFT_61293 [Earliella scabrosa]